MPTLTKDICAQFNVGWWRVLAAIRSGKMKAPLKDSSGRYIWEPEDVQRLRQVLEKVKPAGAQEGGRE